MTEQKIDDRRRFSRIPFDAVAHINADNGDLFLNCQIIDISLKGVLVHKPGQWQGETGDKCRLDLLLDNAQVVIEMEAAVAHIDDDQIGFDCLEIDLDSITHLKRLIELNLADEGLLHRELSSLIEGS
ncbi:MAG TPA: PilZ domain-containing protein [Methylophaga aminisulfidivorans]|uniref:Cyclic diguanosine monophosphate-binding protein n=2 Tax=root TaxID=1 RepID=A0A7C1ZRL1_9GAMM|nr:PilZ domain-containing protein [Methylophaga aminisulfidivorans]